MDMAVGHIRSGYLADLLVVAGDPTADVTILQDKSRLTAIIKGGQFHKNQMNPHGVQSRQGRALAA